LSIESNVKQLDTCKNHVLNNFVLIVSRYIFYNCCVDFLKQ